MSLELKAAALVREARQRRGVTQRELAQRAGTSQSVVARIESGQTSPSVTTLRRLLDAAGAATRVELEPVAPTTPHMLEDPQGLLRLTPEERLLDVRHLGRLDVAARPSAGMQASPRPLHVFTVDLEDWYQGLEIDMDDWGGFAPRVEIGMQVLLDLLAEANVRATFFVLGWQAERTPALIRELAQLGHEVASHGYSHRFVYRQPPEQFRAELRRSKRVLEDITGRVVSGFRAPFFSVTEESLWALDILVEEGFTYDSSVFPVFNYRYGLPGAEREPALRRTPSGASIFEVPLSTVHLPLESLHAGVNFPMSGGGYFRLYPYRLTWFMAKLLEHQGKGLVFYVHPWEYDPAHPRVPMPRFVPKITHYFNLASMIARTRRLLADFRFSPVRDAYASHLASCSSPPAA